MTDGLPKNLRALVTALHSSVDRLQTLAAWGLENLEGKTAREVFLHLLGEVEARGASGQKIDRLLGDLSEALGRPEGEAVSLVRQIEARIDAREWEAALERIAVLRTVPRPERWSPQRVEGWSPELHEARVHAGRGDATRAAELVTGLIATAESEGNWLAQDHGLRILSSVAPDHAVVRRLADPAELALAKERTFAAGRARAEALAARGDLEGAVSVYHCISFAGASVSLELGRLLIRLERKHDGLVLLRSELDRIENNGGDTKALVEELASHGIVIKSKAERDRERIASSMKLRELAKHKRPREVLLELVAKHKVALTSRQWDGLGALLAEDVALEVKKPKGKATGRAATLEALAKPPLDEPVVASPKPTTAKEPMHVAKATLALEAKPWIERAKIQIEVHSQLVTKIKLEGVE